MTTTVKMPDMEQRTKQSPSTYKVHSLVKICLRLWKCPEIRPPCDNGRASQASAHKGGVMSTCS